jgi:hypothetical protein
MRQTSADCDWEILETRVLQGFPELRLSGSPCATSGVSTVEGLCETYRCTRSMEEKSKEDENE